MPEIKAQCEPLIGGVAFLLDVPQLVLPGLRVIMGMVVSYRR